MRTATPFNDQSTRGFNIKEFKSGSNKMSVINVLDSNH